MKLSLARLCLFALLILEIISGAAIYSLYKISSHEETDAKADLINASRSISVPIASLANTLQETASRIAQHPQTIRALKSGSESERIAQLENIRTFYPDANIQWALPNDTTTSIPLTPPLSVVYSRTLQDGRNELINNAAPALLTLTLAQPVMDPVNKAILGFVVINNRGLELQSIFKSLQLQNTFVELQQSNNNAPYSTLMSVGNSHLKTDNFQELKDLPGTAWRLAVWHPPGSTAKPAVSTSQAYLIVWLALSAFLCTTIGGLYFFSKKFLAHDINTILTFFSDIRHARLRKTYTIKLTDIHSNFEIMYRLGKLMLGKHKQVSDFASNDFLSQTNNRRSFETKQSEVFKTLAEGWTHSLLILDIDNFKYVNDTHGHDAGDALIIQFGKALKEHLRGSDFIARLGGDEFCVIFPNTPLKRATELAERLREKMPSDLQLKAGVTHKLHWSGGLSEYKKSDTSENMALARADSALLEAKRAGRNKTMLAA